MVGLLRAAARLWYLRRLADLQSVPSPPPVERTAAPDPQADRVLLIGNGFAHGWGVLTRDLALAGQLERGLVRRTGRPVVVRHVGAEIMSLAAAARWLGEERVRDSDLVLVVLSLNDAVRLTGVDAYERDMRALLERLRDGEGPAVPVVVTAIPAVDALPHYGGLLGRLVAARAAALNARVEAVATAFDEVEVLHVPAPQPETGRPNGSPAMYAAWSEPFVDACAPLLDRAAVGRPPRAEAPGRTWSWAPGPEVLQRAAETGGAGFTELVRAAKEEFRVDLAYVSMIDGERQHYLANTAQGAHEVPLEFTHCKETIRGDGMVVVENTFADPRFAASPLLDVTQFRFYAGLPLQDAEGRNVATFCVSSVLPHGQRYVDEAARPQSQGLAVDAAR